APAGPAPSGELINSRTSPRSPRCMVTTSSRTAPPIADPNVNPWLRANRCADTTRPTWDDSAKLRSMVRAALVTMPVPDPEVRKNRYLTNSGKSNVIAAQDRLSDGRPIRNPVRMIRDSDMRSPMRLDPIEPSVQPTVSGRTDHAVSAGEPSSP